MSELFKFLLGYSGEAWLKVELKSWVVKDMTDRDMHPR